MKYIYPLGLVLLIMLTGCGQEVKPIPAATETPVPPPLNMTYCDIAPSDLCLEGFGQEDEDKMLILFKADDRSFTDIYLRADQAEGEIIFECQQSQNFPENVYCLGDASSSDEESIKLQIHSKSSNKLIAIGVFIVQYGALPAPDLEFGVTATPEVAAPAPTEVPSFTPEPAYPNYPNPSYSNPSYSNPTEIP